MIALGSLKVGDRLLKLPQEKFNTYNVAVNVRKPDLELLRLVERTAIIFSVFELITTVAVICLVWNPFCFLFFIPFFFRCAALPIPDTPYDHPFFVSTHSVSIVVEGVILLICSMISTNSLQWSDESGRTTVALVSLTLVLAVRYVLTVIQHSHYDRLRMSRVLSNRSRPLAIV